MKSRSVRRRRPQRAAALRFKTTLRSDNNSALFIEVPSRVAAALSSKKRVPVRVTLDGFAYRTTVAVYGGQSYLGVRREIREGAKVGPGDRISVTIQVDEEPRVVEVPQDLAHALTSDRQARASFNGLSYTHRKEYVAWVEAAKRQETRRRRIDKAVSMLRNAARLPENRRSGE